MIIFALKGKGRKVAFWGQHLPGGGGCGGGGGGSDQQFFLNIFVFVIVWSSVKE